MAGDEPLIVVFESYLLSFGVEDPMSDIALFAGGLLPLFYRIHVLHQHRQRFVALYLVNGPMTKERKGGHPSSDARSAYTLPENSDPRVRLRLRWQLE
jgi:hypothetical protein